MEYFPTYVDTKHYRVLSNFDGLQTLVGIISMEEKWELVSVH